MVKRTDEKYLLNIARRLHKLGRSLEFLYECDRLRILPHFTFIKPKVVRTAKLTPERMTELRWEQVRSTIKIEENRKFFNFRKLNLAFNKLNLSDIMLRELKNKIFDDVSKIELVRDNRRDHTLEKLKKSLPVEPAQISIINQTDTIIPNEVADILKFGLNSSIGGRTRPLTLLSKFDSLFEHWAVYARTEKLSELEILSVRARCFVIYDELCKCSTNTSYTKKVNTFLDKNDLLLVPVDKSKNICVLTKSDYEPKIKDVFSDTTKFCLIDSESVSKNPINVRQIIRELEPYISKSDFYKMLPLEAPKRSYGTVKCHKTNFPLRPIVSSVDSTCTGAEKYIQKILKPLENMCTYAINSTKQFKTFFLETRNNFDPSIHEIICIDAQKLYTSVNIELVITEIIKEIYKSPTTFFKIDPTEKTNTGFCTKIPPEIIFKNFRYKILIKINSFSTIAGFYQQTNGLSMGSKISPLIANFYLNLMEQKIIQEEIQKGNISAYCRFVDDCYCIVRKNQKNRILKRINNFDPKFLTFTNESMKNNSLTFLDTEIYINEQNLPEIKKFRKKTASDVIMNYNTITPKKYKLSTLKGDIFRCHYTCSTEQNLNKALNDLTELYVKNEYPRRLVNNTIQEIRKKKFENNGNQNNYQELRKNAPNQFYTLCIPFTSNRREKVASKLIRLLKTNTPNYHINISWKLEKLQKFFSHKLKMPVTELEKIGVTYKFDCLCQESYIGESKRQLQNRIKEHNQKSKQTAISNHIYGNNLKNIEPCSEYNSEIRNQFGAQPNPHQKFTFIKKQFTLLQNNVTNTHDRRTFKAIAITIHKPKLNAQVLHRKVSII